jgi:hypothetical protein
MSRQPLDIQAMNDRCLKSHIRTFKQRVSFLYFWLQLDNTTVSFVGGMHSMGRENGQIYNTAGVIPNVETRDGSCPSTLQSRQCQACPSNAE